MMKELLLQAQVSAINDVMLHYWRQFLLLLPRLFLAIFIIAAAIFIASQLSRLLNIKLNKRSSDPLLVAFIAQIAKWALILAGITFGLSVVGFTNMVGGLIAGASVSALVIGFAFKDIGENFLAGIILAFNRPFLINDTIGIAGFMGEVVALGLRSTRIKTFDGQDVFIPNSVIMKSNLANFTADGNVRLDFKIFLDLSTDIEKACATVLEAIKTIEGVQEHEGPFCTIEEFTPNAVVMRVYFWMHTFNYATQTLAVKTRAMDAALRALRQSGATILGMPKA